jgi:poly(3-hydroxybutyrate) depolymerase
LRVERTRRGLPRTGRTQAAHGLCTAIPDERRVLYVQPQVGHYGVFNGRRFRDDIYPRIRDFIALNEGLHEASRGVPERTAAAA